MRHFTRQIRLYFPFTKNIIKKIMSYRFDFFMIIAAGLIGTFVLYYLWKAIFISSGKETLAGFTMKDIIIYVFMTEITSRLIRSNVDNTVATEVRDGTIAMNLIKPINYRTRLVFEAFGSVIHQAVTIALPLWIGLIAVRFFTLGEAPPDLITVIGYCFSIFFAFLLLFLFNFCFGLLAFFTTSIMGLRMTKGAFLGILTGSLIPLNFFPQWFQNMCHFMPFQSMNYVPVMVYIGKITGTELLIALLNQAFWVLVLLALTEILWRQAVKRLTILGG